MQKLFILIATFVLGTTAHAADFYGAIAFSSATGISGTSYNWATRGQAEFQALKACNQNDCQVVAWVKNGCAALSVGQANMYGWAWNTFLGLAQTNSLIECSARTTNCKLQVSFCSNG